VRSGHRASEDVDVKVHIDADRCEGHGRCYSLAPQLFEPDEIGNGRVVADPVPDHLQDDARRAVANCPEQAITIGSNSSSGNKNDEEASDG
jgi:ferredoxin